MGFLDNKRILITGMISNRSIAYGIAQAMHKEGAELAFTYQGDRVKDRTAEMAKNFGSEVMAEIFYRVQKGKGAKEQKAAGLPDFR